LILENKPGLFDGHIAHGGLIYHSEWVRVLQRVMRACIDVVVGRGWAIARLV